MSITRDVLVSVNSILIGANVVQLVMLDEAMVKVVGAIVACVQVAAIWFLMKEDLP